MKDVLEWLLKTRDVLNQKADEQGVAVGPSLGVVAKLIDNGADIKKLSHAQKYHYNKVVMPLLNVECDGLYDTGCIHGDFIDDESLLLSYEEGDFKCQNCRYEEDRHART